MPAMHLHLPSHAVKGSKGCQGISDPGVYSEHLHGGTLLRSKGKAQGAARMQVYNEGIYDLLRTEAPLRGGRALLRIKEDAAGRVLVDGLQEVAPTHPPLPPRPLRPPHTHTTSGCVQMLPGTVPTCAQAANNVSLDTTLLFPSV